MQHDWHIRGVKQAHWVRATHAPLARGFDRDLNSKTLEIDDCGKNNKCGQKIHYVGQVLPVESLTKSSLFIRPSQKKMEECNDSSFELRPAARVDGGWGECFPDNRLANVGCDEE